MVGIDILGERMLSQTRMLAPMVNPKESDNQVYQRHEGTSSPRSIQHHRLIRMDEDDHSLEPQQVLSHNLFLVFGTSIRAYFL